MSELYRAACLAPLFGPLRRQSKLVSDQTGNAGERPDQRIHLDASILNEAEQLGAGVHNLPEWWRCGWPQ